MLHGGSAIEQQALKESEQFESTLRNFFKHKLFFAH